MAIVQVLDKSFIGEGLNAPKIAIIDQIESEGSLLLFDASKYSGALENNTSIPNLFNENAKKITGTDSPLTLRVSQDTQNHSRLERSAKGGIHFIPNPNLGYGVLDNYAALRGLGGVKNYMRQHAPGSSNPHNFFISIWFRITSLQTWEEALLNGTYERDIYFSNYSNSSNYNLEAVYFAVYGGDTAVNKYRHTLITPAESGKAVPLSTTHFNLFNFGPASLNSIGRTAKKYGATMIYRAYVEDLTVSGRSREEVEALDLALYTRAFAEGGKFYGDTWTNPTTAF